MKKYPKWDEQSPTRRDPTVDRAPDGIDWHQVAKESSRTRDFCAELFDKIQVLSDAMAFVTHAELDAQIVDIQSQLPSQTLLDTIQAEITALKETVPSSVIVTLQTALDNLQTQVNGLPISTIQGQLESEISSITTLQGTVNGIQSQIDGLPISVIQSNITTLQGQITAVNSQITALQNQIADLQSADVAVNGQIAALQSQVTTAQGNITTLQAQVDAIRVKATGPTVVAGPNETWLVLAGNSSDITGITLTPVMTMTAVGPGRYWFSCKLIYQTTALSTGIDVAVNHTGTLTQFVAEHKYASGSGAAASESDLSASGATYQVQGTRTKNAIIGGGTTGTDAANSDMISIIEGFFVVSVSGDLQIKLAAEVAGLVCRAMQGSFLELKKLS